MLNVCLTDSLQTIGRKFMADPAFSSYEKLLFMCRILEGALINEVPLHYNDYTPVVKSILKDKIKKVKHSLDEAYQLKSHINMCKDVSYVKEMHEPLLDAVRLDVLDQFQTEEED